MPELVTFAALDWEARAMCDALAGVEPAGARTWRGHLGDGASCLVLQIGIGPVRAAAAAAAAPAARAFLSVGCAGALVAPLAAGDALAAGEVLCVDAAGVVEARLPAQPAGPVAWAAARNLRLPAVPIASGPAVVDGVLAKARLAATGAVAVEMESAAIAAEAQRRGMPFVGLRVVLDGPEDAVPLLGGAVDEATGALRPLRAAAAAATRPWTWPAVMRLARQQRVAEHRLRRLCAVLAGGGLEAFLPPAGAARPPSGQ